MSTDSWIKSFTHLNGRPRAIEALSMLKKIASLVKPIMRSHQWMLPVLTEFFPDQENLLGMNVNMGQKILLRLRPAHTPDAFLEVEEVVQTMLHELTHNVHGPHDDNFYRFLAGLQDEYEKLLRSGYAGEGFYSKGNRLGVGISHNVPPHIARSKAIDAAEKRRRLAQVMGDSGGRKLGGDIVSRPGMTPRELAVMAAERRARDEKGCGQGIRAQEEAAKAADNSVIDLTGDSDEEDEVIIIEDGRPTQAGPSAKVMVPRPHPALDRLDRKRLKVTFTGDNQQRKRVRRPESQIGNSDEDPKWECSSCTLLNKASALQCDVCLRIRPVDRTSGWTCLTCGEGPILSEFWTCTFCGKMKTSS